MSNFSGNWKIIRSENFEEMLKALGKEVIPASRRAGGAVESAETGTRKKGGPGPGGACGGVGGIGSLYLQGKEQVS